MGVSCIWNMGGTLMHASDETITFLSACMYQETLFLSASCILVSQHLLRHPNDGCNAMVLP